MAEQVIVETADSPQERKMKIALTQQRGRKEYGRRNQETEKPPTNRKESAGKLEDKTAGASD